MGNYYSYKRISTDTERQNFNRQIKSLEKFATDHNIEYLIEFVEEKSAKNFDVRLQFKKLDKLLQAGDTVVFKDLYRFTREAENGYEKYMEELEYVGMDDSITVAGLPCGDDDGSHMYSNNYIYIEKVKNIGGHSAYRFTGVQQGKVYIPTDLIAEKTTLKMDLYIPDTSTARLHENGLFAMRVLVTELEPDGYDGAVDGYINYNIGGDYPKTALQYNTWQTVEIDISGWKGRCYEFAFNIGKDFEMYVKNVTIA